MTDGNENENGSMLVKAIELIAITPADASALVSQYKTKAKHGWPHASDVEIEQAVVKKIISRYAKMCAFSGSATALSGVVPGIGTAVAMVGGGLADTTITMKFQVDMVMCIADAVGWDITSEDAKHACFLIVGLGSLEKLGVEEVGRLASNAGVKMIQKYLAGPALVVVKELFKKVGISFTQKSLVKAFPFGIGVALGGSVNYALTKYIGNSAYKMFVIDREMKGHPVRDEEPMEGVPA